MRTYNRFTRQFLCSAMAVAIMLVAACVRAEQVQQVVTVLKVSGNARYSTDSMKTWHKMRKGEQLLQGTLIQTADDGQVDLMMGELTINPTTPVDDTMNRPTNFRPDNKGPRANVLHLFPSTVMVVDKLFVNRTDAGEVSDTQLDLRAGEIAGNVKKLSGGSRYEVKIPNGVAGIRGTTFFIGADGRVFVLTGSVVISYIDRNGILQTEVVTAGYQFIPRGGGPGIISPLTPLEERIFDHLPIPPLTGPIVYPRAPGIIVHVSPN